MVCEVKGLQWDDLSLEFGTRSLLYSSYMKEHMQLETHVQLIKCLGMVTLVTQWTTKTIPVGTCTEHPQREFSSLYSKIYLMEKNPPKEGLHVKCY